jgi:hypothetical protein
MFQFKISPFSCLIVEFCLKYDKQGQQGKAAFNERSPHTIQQQEPVAMSPGGPKTKTGQGTRKSMGRLITKNIHKKEIIST